VSKGLKLTFLIHAVISFVFGIGLYVFPGTMAKMFNWTPLDPTMARFYGGALLAMSVGSKLGYRATSWEQVRIIVATEIAFCVLGVVGTLYSLLVDGAPAFAWVPFALYAVFAILWIYFYVKASKKPATTV